MSETIIKMREQMAEKAVEARKQLDRINDKTPEGEAREIEGNFDKLMTEHAQMQERLQREESLVEIEKAQRELAPAPQAENREARQDAGNTPEYRETFNKYARFGVNSLDSEERSVIAQGFSPEYRAQSVGTDAAGGYTVPEGFSNEIDKAMAAWGPMWDADIVRELTTGTGNRVPWPTIDDTANTGRIKAENAAADDDGSDDIVFGEKLLDAYMYDTGVVRFSWELMQDSAFNMEALASELFGERLGRLANSQLTVGTGSGQPNGIVTAATSGKTAASATAITFDEMIDLFHSVDPAYRQSAKCRWQFNDTTFAALSKLKDGQGNYLWRQGDVRSGEPDMLWNKPYSVNQAMANPATTTTPVLFGDHSRYVVRKVDGFKLLRLNELYAASGQVGMIGYKRFDGELLNTSAVKKLTMA